VGDHFIEQLVHSFPPRVYLLTGSVKFTKARVQPFHARVEAGQHSG
jgi:hypothetical protein